MMIRALVAGAAFLTGAAAVAWWIVYGDYLRDLTVVFDASAQATC